MARVAGTDVTLGLQTAVQIVTDAIDPDVAATQAVTLR